MDFTTRLLVRHCAILGRMRSAESHKHDIQYAVGTVTSWYMILAATVLLLVHVVFRRAIPDAWSLLNSAGSGATFQYVIVGACAFGFVWHKARPFAAGIPPDILAQFNSRSDWIKWWCTSLSILPLLACMGTLFMVGHGYW